MLSTFLLRRHLAYFICPKAPKGPGLARKAPTWHMDELFLCGKAEERARCLRGLVAFTSCYARPLEEAGPHLIRPFDVLGPIRSDLFRTQRLRTSEKTSSTTFGE